MNQITQALKQAGVKVPSVTNRVWHYVADHPNVNCKTISQVLGLGLSETATSLNILVRRKMCSKHTVDMKVRAGNGWAVKGVLHYTVTVKTYELLPLPKRTKTPALKPVAVKIEALKLNIETMPLGEARALYEQLKRVFG